MTLERERLNIEAQKMRDKIPGPFATCGKIQLQYPEFMAYVGWLERQLLGELEDA